jgi:4-amino-4-deoxy-L-arabinose transferase-like glycosyltransferase
VFWIFGFVYWPIVLLQIVVGVAVVALAMALARRWFDVQVAILTGWTLACWPLLIQYTTVLASELFFIFFILLALWFASTPLRGLYWRATTAGIFLAAASYVRPLALIMVPLLFIKEAVDNRQFIRPALACVVAGLVMALAILPWAIRNWYAFDRIVLISTNGGSNLWMGNNTSDSTGYAEPPKLEEIANEADRDRFLGTQAKDYIVRDPVAFMVRMVKRAVSLHDRESIGVVWNEKGIVQRFGSNPVAPLKFFSSVYWWSMLALAAYGIVSMTKRSGWASVLACPAIVTWSYYTAVHLVTVGGDRYHVPSIPFIAMLAAYGLSGITALSARRQAPT